MSASEGSVCLVWLCPLTSRTVMIKLVWMQVGWLIYCLHDVASRMSSVCVFFKLISSVRKRIACFFFKKKEMKMLHLAVVLAGLQNHCISLQCCWFWGYLPFGIIVLWRGIIQNLHNVAFARFKQSQHQLTWIHTTENDFFFPLSNHLPENSFFLFVFLCQTNSKNPDIQFIIVGGLETDQIFTFERLGPGLPNDWTK